MIKEKFMILSCSRVLAPVFLVLAFASSNHACDAFNAAWPAMYPANVNTYYSAWPRYNVMVPEKIQNRHREIEDLFLLVDDGSGPGVRLDKPVEDYFADMFASSDAKHQTFDPVRTSLSTPFSSSHWRNVTIDDVTPTGEIFAWYTLKLTGGLIFKTDQYDCNTHYAHPLTRHEVLGGTDPTEVNNHDEFIDPDGNLVVSPSDTYCYFMYIPGSENLDPLITRVHQNDMDGQYYIYKGMASYMRLKSSLHSKLDAGEGDMHYVKGRYILPGKGGRFLIPQNGLNLLFNRVTIYRPYHRDQEKLTYGSSVATNVYNSLGSGMPPLNVPSFDVPVGGMFKITGSNFFLKGLEADNYISNHNDDNSGGSQGNFGSNVGSIYLAFDPEDANPKEWPYAMHFPNSDAEKHFLENALGINGNSFPDGKQINHNRDPSMETAQTAVYGVRALSQTELNDGVFRDGNRFQLWMKSDYDMSGTDVDIGLGPGTTEIACATTEPAIKAYCDQFTPLMTELENFFGTLGVTKPSPPYSDYPSGDPVAPDDLNTLLSTSTAVVATDVGPYSWDVQQKLPSIVDAMNSDLNKEYNDAIFEIPTDPNFNKFVFQTDVGRKIASLRGKLDTGMRADDQRYSDAYYLNNVYTGVDEDTYFTNTMASVQSEVATMPATHVLDHLQTELAGLLVNRYIEYEVNDYGAGSFKFYTASESSGRRLLTRLGTVQKALEATGAGLSAPGGGEIEWKYYAPDSVASPCLDPTLAMGNLTAVSGCFGVLGSPTTPEADTSNGQATSGTVSRYSIR